MIDTCNSCEDKKLFKREEQGKSFIIQNRSQIAINEVKVDGCLMKHGRKCDWLYEIDCNNVRNCYYVELKGNKLSDGLEQLLETIEYCKDRFKHQGVDNRYACIVLSRYPQEDSSIQNLKRKLKKRKITLKVKSRQMEIVI